MCGIVGIIGENKIGERLLQGLKKLEYRGYDSAGMVVLNGNSEWLRLRVVGKVKALADQFSQTSFAGVAGLAHTRWATHGVPSESNAHPFISQDEFAIVHNGIIENHAEIKSELLKKGYVFQSETDSETVAHLLHHLFQSEKNIIQVLHQLTKQLQGAYALGIVSKHHPGQLFGVRQGCPLVLGLGERENFLASDPIALLAETKKFIYLKDHDVLEMSAHEIKIYDEQAKLVQRAVHELDVSQDAVEKGVYRHYMQKEMIEQPQSILDCLSGRLHEGHVLSDIFGLHSEAVFAKTKQIHLVACGTSYHAAMVAKYWIEQIAKIPTQVDIASEYRYRDPAVPDHTLFVAISQSGETADTLAALHLAKEKKYLSTLVICNVAASAMVRDADLHFLTRAGIEIGVASTKAFTTQLTAFLLLAIRLSEHRAPRVDFISDLIQLPKQLQSILPLEKTLHQWARWISNVEHVLFLGRGLLFPIALEGALKMKELSYIHAEGYASGELKHGPLALVDENMPVIALAPKQVLFDKMLSNLEVVKARGGKLLILSDDAEFSKREAFSQDCILTLPSIHPMLSPILYTLPLQWLAYHVALAKGTDVDQPRNLAKSVTVE